MRYSTMEYSIDTLDREDAMNIMLDNMAQGRPLMHGLKTLVCKEWRDSVPDDLEVESAIFCFTPELVTLQEKQFPIPLLQDYTPEHGEELFMVALDRATLMEKIVWNNCELHKLALSRGILHKDANHARAHGKALLLPGCLED